eukprot:SAG31_NODE_322_length_17726_cov_18.070006_18_plen_67_part_01
MLMSSNLGPNAFYHQHHCSVWGVPAQRPGTYVPGYLLQLSVVRSFLAKPDLLVGTGTQYHRARHGAR